MQKLLALLACGLAAASLNAAAEGRSTRVDKSSDALPEAPAKDTHSGPAVGATGSSGADARGDANAGASTASENALPEKRGTGTKEGVAKDSDEQAVGKRAKKRD